MKLHACFSVLTVLGLGLTFLAASSRGEVLDWNNITYAPTPTQATTKTALTDTAITDNTISFQYTLNNSATFSTRATSPDSGSNNDNTTYYAIAGGDATQRSLQSVMDFTSSNDSVTETIFFAQPVTNVSFKLFDVDAGTVAGGGYADLVQNIMGVTPQGSTAYAANVTGSMDNTVSGTGATFQVLGNASNAQTANLGDVTIDFGTSRLSQISFTYGDNYTGTTHSVVQLSALGNITFTTVPEPGPMAAVGLGMAAAAVAFWRRR